MGKTTSAKLLAEKEDFVFYEGDYYSEDNPYTPMIYQTSVQRKLAGKSPEERKLAVREMWEEGELKSLREYHYRTTGHFVKTSIGREQELEVHG